MSTSGNTPKILLIGAVGAGKTSLKQALNQETLCYKKTQVMDFSSIFIDCPGEYLEIPRYYHILIDASHRVSEIWALHDSTKKRSYFPPNFAHVFRKPVIGVITKIDLPQADRELARTLLSYAGISEPYYEVSVLSGEGISSLAQRLR